MYKVILVDDEQFITDGLISMLNWNEFNLEVVGTASTGEELLNLFKDNPADIVISDIHLPDINGLNLIGSIKSDYPDVKFIVLSGYDDFAYLQEGIRLGIENYLLKPVSKKELTLTLKNTVEKIERTVTIENFLKNDFNILRDNILYRWVTNSIDYQELLERADLLKINLDYQYYTVSCIKLIITADDDLYSNKEASKAVSALYSLCNANIIGFPEFMSFCDLSGNIIIIAGSNTKSFIQEELSSILNKIKSMAKTKLSLDTFITVGNIEQSYANIHKSYSAALEAQDYILILPEDTIIYYSDITDMQKKSSIKEELDLEGFGKTLSTGNIDEISDFVDNFFDNIKEKQYLTPSDVQNYAIEMMLLILKYFDDKTLPFSSSSNNYKSLFSSLLKIHNLSALKEEIKKSLRCFSHVSIDNNKNLSPIIKQILTYVNANYSKDVCLKSLGNIFNINSAYLGQLFQKEMNESLSEYVNHLRMQRSKELLMTTNLRNIDIALAVGFYDPNYFYKKFKDFYKVSPAAMRSTLLYNRVV